MTSFITKYVVPFFCLVGALFAVSWFVVELVRGQRVDFTVQELAVPETGEAYARGADLFVTRGCADCHGADGGGKVFINDKAIGRFAGSNLTVGRGGMAPEYKTAKDWDRAIRYGLNYHSMPLVFMPSNEFRALSNKDAAALILYLTRLPPVDREVPKSNPGPLARVLYLFGQFPLLLPYGQIDDHVLTKADVPIAANAEYGGYLAASCVGCHRDSLTGGKIQGVPPDWPPAANITRSGVMEDYSVEQFKNLMRTGRTVKGRVLDTTYMPWQGFSRLKDIELEALYIYLRSR